jgi:hypothetical protein
MRQTLKITIAFIPLAGYVLNSSNVTRRQPKRAKAIERGCRGKSRIKSDLRPNPVLPGANSAAIDLVERHKMTAPC